MTDLLCIQQQSDASSSICFLLTLPLYSRLHKWEANGYRRIPQHFTIVWCLASSATTIFLFSENRLHKTPCAPIRSTPALMRYFLLLARKNLHSSRVRQSSRRAKIKMSHKPIRLLGWGDENFNLWRTQQQQQHQQRFTAIDASPPSTLVMVTFDFRHSH